MTPSGSVFSSSHLVPGTERSGTTAVSVLDVDLLIVIA